MIERERNDAEETSDWCCWPGAASRSPPATASAEELTIFWAEWDPANYLQELVNEYTAETGVTVTVETTPWPDFQTKAFAEFNAKGDAYDMVVGDFAVAGRGLDRGSLGRPDRLLQPSTTSPR